MPAIARTAPCASKFARRALPRSAGISRRVARSASRQTGRLTKKTQRQPGPSEITPPRKTPAADPIPAVAPQAPSALVRSLPALNVVVTIDTSTKSRKATPQRSARVSFPSRVARADGSEAVEGIQFLQD